jgi:hypothetical protein
MNLPAGLFLAVAIQSVHAPPAAPGSTSPLRGIDCVRLKAAPLAATSRSEASIAYEAVRACEPALGELAARAEAASGRERDTLTSLRHSLIERMLMVAEDTVRQQRGR